MEWKFSPEGKWEILLGILIGWWESEEEWCWPFESFSKLKITFCKLWASSKLAWPLYTSGVLYKMMQGRWLQLKLKFLLGYNVKIVIWCGQLTFGTASTSPTFDITTSQIISSGGSFMNSKNSEGPKMEPWGTPASTGYFCKNFPSRTMQIVCYWEKMTKG